MYRLILGQVLREVAPDVLVVPVGTGNLALGAILAARDCKRQLGKQVRVVGAVPYGEENVLRQVEAVGRGSLPKGPAIRRSAQRQRGAPVMTKLESAYTPLLACIRFVVEEGELEIFEAHRAHQMNALKNLLDVRPPKRWISVEPSAVASFAVLPEVVARHGRKSILVVNSGAGVLSKSEHELLRGLLNVP